MKNQPTLFALLAAIAATTTATAAPSFVPDGDFSLPDRGLWSEVSGGDATYEFSYPQAGGNPGAYGIINNSAVAEASFGIWVSNDEAIISLESLGLEAGNAYVFYQDMILLSGTEVGGFKIDFFSGGAPASIPTSGEFNPDPMGTAGTWQTYNFRISIPSDADGIKVVPLAGLGSEVGYDNICFDPQPIPLPPIPNGDFEGGANSWAQIGSDTTWTYPATGGNPGAYGVMSHGGAPGSFGIWVSNGNAILRLDNLGISSGSTVAFTQDMILLSGSQLGGLKVEFYTGNDRISEEESRPPVTASASSWTTYRFDIDIPATADGIKLVPLWGPGSTVGYDNITFSLPAPLPFAAEIQRGSIVSWIPQNEDNLYQPQASDDDETWRDLGPLVPGTTADSVFAGGSSPFYRVVESESIPFDDATNGGFEDADFDNPEFPEFWDITPTAQPATRTISDARTGIASLRIAVDNGGVATPQKAEAQQELRNTIGSIIPGGTYDLRFWAKQISSGVSYVQRYSLRWFNELNEPISQGTVSFRPFTGGDGVWSEITSLGLVAPEGAVNAQIQIFGETGALADPQALGEVLIDDLSFTTTLVLPRNETLPVTLEPGIEITWPTTTGKTYQVEAGAGLDSLSNIGPEVTGDGERASFTDTISDPDNFFRVIEAP